MASVVYTGWTSREPSRRSHSVTSFPAQLKKSVRVEGERFVFRGRAGKKSQPRTVTSEEAVSYFKEHPDFEVKEEG